jgi:hypothetical protein
LQAGSKTSERPGKAIHPAPATTATTDSLRRVAEEVRAAFPRRVDAPELVLIDIDPRNLHAFWNLAAEDVERARRELGDEGGDAPMVLRISETDGGAESAEPFDVEVLGLQGRCYVDIWGEARGYSGTLGLRGADGKLRPLAGPAMARLPNIGRPDQHPPRKPAAQAAGATASPAIAVPAPRQAGDIAGTAEPISHPFPQPPSEPGSYDALAASPVIPNHSPAASSPDRAAAGESQARSTADPGIHAAHAAHSSPPEPVSHPFPLPPTEPGDYAPEQLVGGFLPADTGPIGEGGPPAATSGEAEPPAEGTQPRRPEGEGEPAPEQPAPEQPPALPLENVLTLSSYALGRESVEFEINAELHVFGRARPGTRLQLFGRPVPLRPDGSFYVVRPLPNGAVVLPSLLVEGDGASD